MLYPRNIKVKFNHNGINYNVTGRAAQTLLYLVDKQDIGITSLEMSNWALRLSAYIHILRSEYMVDIQTNKEPHDGGLHARYVLISDVSILDIVTTD